MQATKGVTWWGVSELTLELGQKAPGSRTKGTYSSAQAGLPQQFGGPSEPQTPKQRERQVEVPGKQAPGFRGERHMGVEGTAIWE